MGSGASTARCSDRSEKSVRTKGLVAEDVQESPESRPTSGKKLLSRRSSSAKIKPVVDDSSSHDQHVLKAPNLKNGKSTGYSCELQKEAIENSVKKTKEAEDKLLEREQQMAKLEGENLDLQDTITSLEGQLQYYRNASAVTDNLDCEETLNIKDQTIVKLEDEIKSTQEQIRKIRIKYKKKLRLVSSQLAEATQTTSVNVLEMKEEVNRLREENERLEQKIMDASKGINQTSDAIAAAFDVGEDSRTRIILDLSNKVSEQDSAILKLEQSIVEKDKEIYRLKSDNSGGSYNASVIAVKSRGDSNFVKNSSNTSVIDSDSNDISELKQIAEEMKKLKLQKKKPKKKMTSDALESDFRELSSTSRDSGVYEKDKKLKDKSTIPGHKLNDDWESDSDTADVTPIGYKRLGSGNSRKSFTSDLGDTDSDDAKSMSTTVSSIDPSSIRRISAPRKRGKATPEVTDMGLPPSGFSKKPPIAKKRMESLDDDMDTLIQSIDSDMMCVSAVSGGNHGNLTTVSG